MNIFKQTQQMKFPGFRWVGVLVLLLVGGCQSLPVGNRDGSSFENAAVVDTSSPEAVYEWIHHHYPHAQIATGTYISDEGEEVTVYGHRTQRYNNRVYSIYTLEFPDGSLKDVYFVATGGGEKR